MTKLLAIGLTFVASLFAGFGSLFLKKGSDNLTRNLTDLLQNFKLFGGILVYALSSLFFIAALRLQELSMLYPITSLSYVWVSLLSIKYLDESMNKFKWIGIVLIIIGVSLVTR